MEPNAGGRSLPKVSLSTYFSASRLRTDAWHKLKTLSRQLGDASRRNLPLDELAAKVLGQIETLRPIEGYHAFPGRRALDELRGLLDDEEHERLARQTAILVRMLASHTYRTQAEPQKSIREEAARHDGEPTDLDSDRLPQRSHPEGRPYFQVIVVDALSDRDEDELRERLWELRRDEDEFVYDVVCVPSFEDALIGVLLNYQVQSVVIRYGFPLESKHRLGFLKRTLRELDKSGISRYDDSELALTLASAILRLRPTLDLFLVTDAPVEDIAGRLGRRFRRVFYRQEDYRELHLSLLKGIRERFHTPFFSALRTYCQRPTGVFHALPISRAKSISRSHWIRDMETFYGSNVFLAETSATTAGLDSLLQPHGSLREAQVVAARAFGAQKSYFVTNGTSTANKIVLQALLRPGDIVLASRDCHQSHHYSIVLTGAHPIYLDPYPIAAYSIYGAVPLIEIKQKLLALKQSGKLERVKMLLLTNCTFDGIVYNPERVMQEVLAIKPDMVFVWDEAWFAFAYFTPITRRRTAMAAARALKERLRSAQYRERWRADLEARVEREAEREGAPEDEAAALERELLPDPDRAKIRVYSTQSTHKTLTSLRQGSMIHIYDTEFERQAATAFHQAYLTHTSTSANYQILASLDIGRRQVELEGYELVQRSAELALTLRERVNAHPTISRFFRVLTPEDLVPARFRPSGFRTYRELKTDWARLDQAWEDDEFCLDPTRLTLYVGPTGIDGDTFKKRLIEEFDIQINKTSRNTVLFMTHIGTTRGAIAYLIEVLARIAEELEEKRETASPLDERLTQDQVSSLTERLPPLPNFSTFHRAFRPDSVSTTGEGDLRTAFFSSFDERCCTYLKLGGPLEAEMATGREVVAAGFITPYPPGFPILVPGQVVSTEILDYLKALDVKEIHGYEPAHGLRVFTEEALLGIMAERTAAERRPAPFRLEQL